MSRLFVFTLVPDRPRVIIGRPRVPDHSLRSGQVAIPQDSIVKIESGRDAGTMRVNGFTVFGDFEQFTRDWWSDSVVIDSPTVT